MHVYMYVHMYVHMHVCIRMYSIKLLTHAQTSDGRRHRACAKHNMYVCVYVCMCVYVYVCRV